jgi:hypothetical protein
MNFLIKTGNIIRQAKSELVSNLYWIKQGKFLRKLILEHYKTIKDESVSEEEARVIEYLKNNNLSFLPYEFTKKYTSKNVDVFFDKEYGLNYVIFNNKSFITEEIGMLLK